MTIFNEENVKQNDFKLKKIDRNSNIILESSDMFQQLGYAIHPVYMQEENQYLFLSDTTLGIFVFDVCGADAFCVGEMGAGGIFGSGRFSDDVAGWIFSWDRGRGGGENADGAAE